MPPSWQQQPQYAGIEEAQGELANKTETLWRRLQDIEEALSVREWWMLGRVLPTARLLAEISSLLAVARGELETALTQAFQKNISVRDQSDAFETIQQEPAGAENDPAWLEAARDQSFTLLRMVAGSLPAMIRYAELLISNGERLRMGPAATDAFGVVLSRLHEAYEALREPPQ
jgi:hypothetical protein